LFAGIATLVDQLAKRFPERAAAVDPPVQEAATAVPVAPQIIAPIQPPPTRPQPSDEDTERQERDPIGVSTSSAGEAKKRLYISCRSADYASVSTLREALKQQLGDTVLLASSTVAREAEQTRQRVAECDAFLLVIGPEWAHSYDDRGRRRIEDPTNGTHIEIATAIARKTVIIPILLGGTRLLRAKDLPGPLQSIAELEPCLLRDETFQQDLVALFKLLSQRVLRRPIWVKL
jgi:hypothetical protein